MLKTCYIFGAAEGLPNKLDIQKDDLVIAADAGYSLLKRLDISPDIVLGDFDSLKSIPECKEIIKHPVKKDDTDTLLAVKTAFSRGFSRFVLYGCIGGKRIDHTLANIQTLCFIAENGGTGFLCAEDYTVTAIKNSSVRFSEKAKGYVSVFSAVTKARGVCLEKLLYPLQNADISYSFPLGVSNEFTGKEALISVSDGTLIVVWQGGIDALIL